MPRMVLGTRIIPLVNIALSLWSLHSTNTSGWRQAEIS